MPTDYRIHRDRQLVISRAYGILTYAEACAHRRVMASDPGFDPTYAELLDGREIDRVEMSAEELSELAARSLFQPDARRAFVSHKPSVFGLFRMYEAYRVSAGDTAIGVFPRIDEALDWLGVTGGEAHAGAGLPAGSPSQGPE